MSEAAPWNWRRKNAQCTVQQTRASDGGFQCPICLEPPVRIAMTHCGHFFCERCLYSVLQRSSDACPLCRQAIDVSRSDSIIPLEDLLSQQCRSGGSMSGITAAMLQSVALRIATRLRQSRMEREVELQRTFASKIEELEEALRERGQQAVSLMTNLAESQRTCDAYKRRCTDMRSAINDLQMAMYNVKRESERREAEYKNIIACICKWGLLKCGTCATTHENAAPNADAGIEAPYLCLTVGEGHVYTTLGDVPVQALRCVDELIFDRMRFGEGDLEKLPYCDLVKKLHFLECHGNFDSGVYLCALRHLTAIHLNFTDDTKCVRLELPCSVELLTVANMANLEELVICNGEALGCITGVSALQKLSTLELHNTAVDDVLFKDLAKAAMARKLRRCGYNKMAKIATLPLFSTAVLFFGRLLLDKWPQLGLQQVSDDSNEKGLRSLKITNCRNIRDVSPVEHIDGLEALDFEGCTGIERGWPSLAKLKMLQVLRLGGTTYDDSLIASEASRKRLHTLALSSCTRATSEGERTV
ncbi:putative leucine rich repeat protein (LRRP) [Trypanosoma vivax]|uniref:RING-type domain-containing protein n=1 Tax=Trypanosoma vivax (strain Y486) TaxID=1055687 RepID=F9WRY7_TRYVY|nr:hypothetical protein TRVL_00663 [Trypanosoma vivax]KAH8618648.1 putative leucine rich repeat protein (LRRP) [Trypanosoma vivax]CCD20323.1 hypothetical protein, conserved [Trypanosoma vivax Y486]|eukprot:CCD20323.1 hypothetical protein, conserved [Trypanosoma vivax Y486]